MWQAFEDDGCLLSVKEGKEEEEEEDEKEDIIHHDNLKPNVSEEVKENRK